MNSENFNELLSRMLFKVLGAEPELEAFEFQGGGCINNGVRVQTSEGDFFIKWNELEEEDMFEKEALGLKLLMEANALEVPNVIGFGKVENKSFLVLEYIKAEGTLANYWKSMGEGLAQLHSQRGKKHGLEHNNYIGRLHQNNEEKSSWIDFYIKNRLNVQLGLALYNGEVDQRFVDWFKQLYDKLPSLIPESAPVLLHGDLWSGNVIRGTVGKACLIDPAVYYGCREMDLAMTHLFGGFDQAFYDVYQSELPLEPGFQSRREIYNLYPLMVHVNLFGADAGYLASVKRTVQKYL